MDRLVLGQSSAVRAAKAEQSWSGASGTVSNRARRFFRRPPGSVTKIRSESSRIYEVKASVNEIDRDLVFVDPHLLHEYDPAHPNVGTVRCEPFDFLPSISNLFTSAFRGLE